MIIGVTGNIASGKTTVTNIFKEFGAGVINADDIGRDVVESNSAIKNDIRKQFGSEIVSESNIVNRSLLGERVFSDPEAMGQLNKLVHPFLLAELQMNLVSLRRVFQTVIVDAALIVEWGAMQYLDVLVLVVASAEIQIGRLMQRNGYSRVQAEIRINAQMPVEQKKAEADYIIENNGNLDALKERAESVYREIARNPVQQAPGRPGRQ